MQETQHCSINKFTKAKGDVLNRVGTQPSDEVLQCFMQDDMNNANAVMTAI